MATNHENHKLLWNELARTGGDDKVDAAEPLNLPEAKFYCYACESTMNGYQEDCRICPIQWGDGEKGYHSCTENEQSLYGKWLDTHDKETRKKYAKIIANIEWKEGGHHE